MAVMVRCCWSSTKEGVFRDNTVVVVMSLKQLGVVVARQVVFDDLAMGSCEWRGKLDRRAQLEIDRLKVTSRKLYCRWLC